MNQFDAGKVRLPEFEASIHAPIATLEEIYFVLGNILVEHLHREGCRHRFVITL